MIKQPDFSIVCAFVETVDNLRDRERYLLHLAKTAASMELFKAAYQMLQNLNKEIIDRKNFKKKFIKICECMISAEATDWYAPFTELGKSFGLS